MSKWKIANGKNQLVLLNSVAISSIYKFPISRRKIILVNMVLSSVFYSQIYSLKK